MVSATFVPDVVTATPGPDEPFTSPTSGHGGVPSGVLAGLIVAGMAVLAVIAFFLGRWSIQRHRRDIPVVLRSNLDAKDSDSEKQSLE